MIYGGAIITILFLMLFIVLGCTGIVSGTLKYSSAHFETVRYNDICRRGRTCPEMSEGEHFGIGVLTFALDFTLMMILNIALG